MVSEWDIRPIGVTCQSPGYTKAMTKWNVGDVRSLMNQWYPPENAHGWDKVGLITGAPQAQVDRILLALDPTQAVVQEALQSGANMIITHHPLLLRGASFLNQESAKGRIISALNRHEIALFNAHTNGDVAQDGVAQACAQALELSDIEVLSPEGVNADGQAIGLGRIGSIKPTPLREFAYTVARVMPKGPTGLFVVEGNLTVWFDVWRLAPVLETQCLMLYVPVTLTYLLPLIYVIIPPVNSLKMVAAV